MYSEFKVFLFSGKRDQLHLIHISHLSQRFTLFLLEQADFSEEAE